MTYQHVYNIDGDVSEIVFHPEIGFIPPDALNADYVNYLKWLDEGNTTLPPIKL